MNELGMQYVKVALWAGTLVLGAAIATTPHAQESEGKKQGNRTETLDPRVARELTAAYEELQADEFQRALTKLNSLIESRGDDMKPFDLASVLQIRGAALINLERHDKALRDFERALELDALPEEQNTQLLFNVAQLHFRSENYREAVRYLEQWIGRAEKPNHNAYYMLAAGHYYLENYRTAAPHVERAIGLAEKPKRRYYDLGNIVYAQLDERRKRAQLLERMVEHWPEEKSYWKQLAALYNELGQDRKSFATLEVAYRNGLIDEEDDIVSLAQYYSVHGNPHRGAKMLEKELEAGRVERNVEHLELLSQLWSRAREHRKAVPVLKEAARLSDDGELSYRLGQVLLSDERNADAEKALEAALKKGGLSEDDRADAWMLLGSARFNQAGPGDEAKRAKADKAFEMAQRFGQTRERASEWRGYIAAINRTEQRQAELEAKQEESLAQAAQQRALTACRAQRLSGSELGEECKALLNESAAGDE